MKTLTVPELAERFNVSQFTIRRWLRAGKFGKAAKKSPGGAWRVPEKSVQKWVPYEDEPELIPQPTFKPQRRRAHDINERLYRAEK